MNPVDLDGVALLVVDGPLGGASTTTIAVGVGRFDGETFVIEGPDGVCVLPEEHWAAVAVPIAGAWKARFPSAEFYLVLDETHGGHSAGI